MRFEAAVDLSGSQGASADYFTWLAEHLLQVGGAAGAGAAILAGIFGLGKALEGVAGAVSKKKTAAATA